jgi:ABC-type glycerol-3-phosphate transport system permease component
MNARLARDGVLIAGASLFTLIAVAPLLWIVIGAFKTTADLIAVPPIWLPDFTYWDNFHAVLAQYWPFLLNSLIVTLGATILALVLGVPVAFGLVNFNLRGAHAIADWILSTRMMPPIAAAVPLFAIFRGLGMLDSVWTLIVVYAGFNLPFAVWVAMSFLRRVPREVVEAARIDGCSWFETLTRVVLPMSKSGLVTVATFVFIFSWNEFLLALFLTSNNAKTFPVVISSFIGTGRVYWEYITAASIIQCLPPVVFTFLMQRHIVAGMTMGAVKD